MDLTQIGEQGIIRKITETFHSTEKNITGIGDDCAVIPTNEETSLLITTDSLVENIHFLNSKVSPKDLGYKSAAVNLSDIAAMGGEPKYALLSIACPAQTKVDWLDEFLSGLRSLIHQHDVQLIGGDTTGSNEHLFINLTLIGIAPPQKIKFRSLAKPNDVIYATNYLGDSGAGLECVLQNETKQDKLVSRHNRPQPEIEKGRWLAARSDVHAMMDLSDGLGSDIYKITEQSHCSALIELKDLPVSKEMLKTSQKFQFDPIEMALFGGEDYCLLVTLDSRTHQKIAQEYEKRFGTPLYRLGVMTEGTNVQFTLNGKPQKLEKKSFSHFKIDSK